MVGIWIVDGISRIKDYTIADMLRPLQVNNPIETLLVKTGRVFLYPILGGDA